MLDLKLKPLRIVAGWTVVSNRLYDLACVNKETVEGKQIYKLYYLDEGLLTLRNSDISLYIDWLPANNLDGRYVLAIQNDENLKIKTLAESYDLNEICESMEKWIQEIYPNSDASKLFK